jgi:hypothetical protein
LSPSELPENVTLEWLARQILEIGEEVRAIRQEIQEKILPLRSPRDDANLRRRFLQEDDGRGAE